MCGSSNRLNIWPALFIYINSSGQDSVTVSLHEQYQDTKARIQPSFNKLYPLNAMSKWAL